MQRTKAALSALPGGARSNDGDFIRLGGYAYFWSSLEYGANYDWGVCLLYVSWVAYRNYGNRKRLGFSMKYNGHFLGICIMIKHGK